MAEATLPVPITGRKVTMSATACGLGRARREEGDLGGPNPGVRRRRRRGSSSPEMRPSRKYETGDAHERILHSRLTASSRRRDSVRPIPSMFVGMAYWSGIRKFWRGRERSSAASVDRFRQLAPFRAGEVFSSRPRRATARVSGAPPARTRADRSAYAARSLRATRPPSRRLARTSPAVRWRVGHLDAFS